MKAVPGSRFFIYSEYALRFNILSMLLSILMSHLHFTTCYSLSQHALDRITLRKRNVKFQSILLWESEIIILRHAGGLSRCQLNSVLSDLSLPLLIIFFFAVTLFFCLDNTCLTFWRLYEPVQVEYTFAACSLIPLMLFCFPCNTEIEYFCCIHGPGRTWHRGLFNCQSKWNVQLLIFIAEYVLCD